MVGDAVLAGGVVVDRYRLWGVSIVRLVVRLFFEFFKLVALICVAIWPIIHKAWMAAHLPLTLSG